MRRRPAIWMIRLPPVADPTANQPLGFMVLAAVLRRAGYRNLRILDLAPTRLTEAETLRSVVRERPEVVFLTACTVDVPGLARFSERLRAASPQTRQVVGGPHPSADPVRCLGQLPNVDVAVAYDGEEIVQELIPALESGADEAMELVHGVAFRDRDGHVRSAPCRGLPFALDDNLWPAYDLIDVPAYFTHPRMGMLFKRPEYMSLFTSRGCPYGCTYCHNVFGSRYRCHSAERVVEEMAYLHRQYGIREFQFVDDLFNHDRARTFAICEGILSRGLKVHFGFPNGLRCDRLSREEVNALARAGCWRINVAVETASARLQGQIKKFNDLDRIVEMIDASVEAGILTHGFFMLGFPAETREELRATVEWAVRSKLHMANFFRVIPMHGSRIREDAEQAGISVNNDFLAFEGNGTNFNLSSVSNAEIEHLHREATRRFYRHPRRLARLARVLPRHHRLLGMYAKEFVTRLVIGTTYPHLAQKISGVGGWRRGWRWLASGDAYRS